MHQYTNKYYTEVASLEDLMTRPAEGESSAPPGVKPETPPAVEEPSAKPKGKKDDLVDEPIKVINDPDKDKDRDGGWLGGIFGPKKRRKEARPIKRKRHSTSRAYARKIAAFAGLSGCLAAWWVGGLCFTFLMSSMNLTNLPAPFNYWTWPAYIVISYFQTYYFPTCFSDFVEIAPFALAVVLGLTVVDVLSTAASAVDLWSGKTITFGSHYGIFVKPNDMSTLILSTLSGMVPSMGAEPGVRYFWNELIS